MCSLIEFHEEFGWPLLPKRGDKPLKKLKAFTRAYATATYRELSYYIMSPTFSKLFLGHFTHNKHAMVPWTCLSQDANHEYIDSESLPNGMFLRDPSKIRLAEITSIWDHWARKQKSNSQGLVFLQAEKGDMREDTHVPEKKDAKNQDEGGVDFFAEDTSQPHPDSPAANDISVISRMDFLRTLSKDMVYNRFVDLLMKREEVSVLFAGV
jgi:hypothetical protein